MTNTSMLRGIKFKTKIVFFFKSTNIGNQAKNKSAHIKKN